MHRHGSCQPVAPVLLSVGDAGVDCDRAFWVVPLSPLELVPISAAEILCADRGSGPNSLMERPLHLLLATQPNDHNYRHVYYVTVDSLCVCVLLPYPGFEHWWQKAHHRMLSRLVVFCYVQLSTCSSGAVCRR